MGKQLLRAMFTLLLVQGMHAQTDTFMVIGHRGAMGHETENTLASFQKAMDMGVAMVELDVFKIKSGELAVFHDDELDRLSDTKGPIEALTYEQLQQVVLKGNHKIPLLSEVMDLLNNQIALNIELKGSGTAAPVHEMVDYYCAEKGWTKDHIIISSFKWDELEEMRRLDPQIAIAVLTEKNPVNAIPTAQALNAVAINPFFKTLTAQKVAQIHRAGFKIYTWTVNKSADLAAIREMGADGVFTNFPELAQ